MNLDVTLEKMEIVAENIENCEKKLQVMWEKMTDILEELRKLRNRDFFSFLKNLEKERDQLGEEIRKLRRLRITLEQIEKQYRRAEEEVQDFEEVLLKQPEYYVLHELEQVKERLDAWEIYVK